MFKEGIYPVITERYCAGKSSLSVLSEVIKGGATVVQLREKEISKKKFFTLACEYRKITKEHGVTLIINDHLDIALAVKADGVHLGQDDLPCNATRKISKDLIIGVSTHNVDQALKAKKDGASYINIGPIFPTETKETTIQPLGILNLKLIQSKNSLPFTVMGGIKESNLSDLLKVGAKRIAMVTEITQAEDITGKVKTLQQQICSA